MNTMTRRNFIKATTLAGASLAGGKFLVSNGPKLTSLLPTPAPARAATEKTIAHAVSDVDGHSQCTMRLDTQGGKVIGIRGNPSDPESKGALTERGRHMKEILYAPDRLKYPLKSMGERGEGRWQRISWEEALDVVSERLKRVKVANGAEAIHFMHGHYHSGDILGSYLPRLANLIGTPNVSNPSHVCHMPRVFLEFGFDLGAVFPPDVAHTRCLLLWGGNPEATNKPQEIAVRKARKRGMKLVVIDPRVTPYGREADLHAQLRPGTDGALALGFLHVIVKEGLYDRDFVKEWTVGFDRLVEHLEAYTPERVEEITWVPAETTRKIARLYATTRPACISPRNALDQHTNASCAIRAIDILMAVTGNLDVKGGNIMVLPLSMAMKDMKLYDKLSPEAEERKIGIEKSLYSRLSKTWPSAHTPSVWDAVLHSDPYAVKAMFVMGANPMLACANARVVEDALRRLDFLVVADFFLSPTAELADVVLPAATFLETTRFVTYDTHADHAWNRSSRIALSPKVVEPLGESRSDWRILRDLGRAMGYGDFFPWKDEEEAIDEQLKPLGLTCEDLRAHPEGVIVDEPPFLYKKLKGPFGAMMRKVLKMTKFRDYPDMYKKYEAKGFMTPSKKVEIYSERLKELGADPLPVFREPAESPVSRPDVARDFPLILIAGTKLAPYTHTMMRNIPALRKQCPENLVEIHPKTASKLGIREGERVRVESLRGGILCPAHLTEGIDPRVVHLYHGFQESNCNLLTDHRACDPITGSTGLKSSLCRVRKVA